MFVNERIKVLIYLSFNQSVNHVVKLSHLMKTLSSSGWGGEQAGIKCADAPMAS